MKKRRCPPAFRLVVATAMVVTLFGVLACDCQADFTEADLSRILAGEWQKYKSDKPNFDAGLALQILSPKGDYYVSTGLDDGAGNRCHFRIASVTKTFTAAGIMLLHQRKRLNIDDSITQNIPGTDTPYVPDTPDYDIPYKADITIRMLLMHRAGVFDLSNSEIPDNAASHGQGYAGRDYLEYVLAKDPEHTFTFDELIGINARNHLSYFKPGSSYHYSDTGYSILGKIIERVSGKSYGEFIKAELVVPNGLRDTSLPSKGSDQDLPAPYAKGSIWLNHALQDATSSNLSAHVAEGNIISTPLDLAHWCKRLFEGEAGLTKATVEMMKSGKRIRKGSDSFYGLGIAYTPKVRYGHSGAHEAYLTLMGCLPKSEVAFVMFTKTFDAQKGLDSLKAEFGCMQATVGRIMKRMGH